MTVRELIAKLREVEDKELDVIILSPDGSEFDVNFVQEESTEVYIVYAD